MKTYLKTIKGALPFNDYKVDISFVNKPLLITGRTGSGKTQFLRYIHDKIESASSAKELKALPRLLSHLESIRALGSGYIKDSPEYDSWRKKLHQVEQQLDKLTLELSLDIAKKNSPTTVANNARFLRFYEAGRAADILDSQAGDTLLADPDSQFGNPFIDQSKFLERYLIQRKQRQLLAEQEGVNTEVDQRWFLLFELQLQELFEDPNLQLVYNRAKPAFYIEPYKRKAFRLQEFSRGNLSLFAIYADLLMRAEAMGVATTEFKGIVLIDEIDAHLDISLQRKILPFLMEYFPLVQFIVTTNSPLVVMSCGEAVIYDVERNKTFEQDYSLYSYDAVATEVFNAPAFSALRESIHSA